MACKILYSARSQSPYMCLCTYTHKYTHWCALREKIGQNVNIVIDYRRI